MRTRFSAKAYITFYLKLAEKFRLDVYGTDSKIELDNPKLWFTTKDAKGNKYKEFVPYEWFGLKHKKSTVTSKPDYFLRLFKIAQKLPTKFTVQTDRLFKAFVYLVYPESKNLPHGDISKIVDEWVEAFELHNDNETVSTNNVETVASQISELVEVGKPKITLLTYLVDRNNENFLEIESIVFSFWNFINEKRYDKAWGLLTTKLRQSWLWKNNIDLFEASFSHVKLIELDSFNVHSFDFGKVRCSSSHTEYGVMYDLQQLFQKAKQRAFIGELSLRHIKIIDRYLFEYFESDENSQKLNWLDTAKGYKSIIQLEKEITFRVDFQRFLSVMRMKIREETEFFEKPHPMDSILFDKSPEPYIAPFCYTIFTVIFENKNWLINEISLDITGKPAPISFRYLGDPGDYKY